MSGRLTPTYQGETQFLAWGDGPAGPWVKLLLQDSVDLEPFRGMTAAKKGMAGQRLACVLVEINDDETPKAETDAAVTAAAKDAVKGGELARLAGIMCATPEFQDWIRQTDGCPLEGIETAESRAAVLLRVRCGVKSRAELDHNPEAAEKFHRLIRLPYVESCK